jgi:hypothetical protein
MDQDVSMKVGFEGGMLSMKIIYHPSVHLAAFGKGSSLASFGRIPCWYGRDTLKTEWSQVGWRRLSSEFKQKLVETYSKIVLQGMA